MSTDNKKWKKKRTVIVTFGAALFHKLPLYSFNRNDCNNGNSNATATSARKQNQIRSRSNVVEFSQSSNGDQYEWRWTKESRQCRISSSLFSIFVFFYQELPFHSKYQPVVIVHATHQWLNRSQWKISHLNCSYILLDMAFGLCWLEGENKRRWEKDRKW